MKREGLAAGFENKIILQQKVMDSLSFSSPWHPQYLRTTERKRQPSCNSLNTFWGNLPLGIQREQQKKAPDYARQKHFLEGLFRAVQCHLLEQAEHEEFGISWLFSHYNFVFSCIQACSIPPKKRMACILWHAPELGLISGIIGMFSVMALFPQSLFSKPEL